MSHALRRRGGRRAATRVASGYAGRVASSAAMSITVTLPDGTPLQLPDGATGADAAAAIGPGLARAALAIEVSHPQTGVEGEQAEVRDLARPLPDGAHVSILTKQSGESALQLIRHDAAHVLAAAVMELYPGVRISIGPPIEQGFYYDFEFPDMAVSEEQFPEIEARMRAHIKAGETFERQDVTPAQARERFVGEDQPYKVELIDDLLSAAPPTHPLETVSLYTNGPFTDLCRGPHAPSTRAIGALKLQSVAGAYWRGDSTRTMLTRIYGTAFHSSAELAEHLQRLEQARARDHRKLGRELDLFAFSEVSPGAAFWLPAGTRLWNKLVALSREMGSARGYTEVKTPLIYDAELWKTSGHWGKYRENMFLAVDSDGEEMGAVKPMNCPGHAHLFALRRHSYRDLPVRYSEPGLLHRNEASGVLHGLLRVRHFAQDDAHIFCTEEQIQGEVAGCLELAFATYALFDFDVRLELSTRPDERIGDDQMWDRAEGALTTALAEQGLEVRAEPRRWRLLRPEDRHAHDRLARALLAVGNGSARLLDARALRPGVHRRGQCRAHAGDDPPRVLRLLRAIHRDHARALRGRAAAVARPGAGDRAGSLRPLQRLRHGRRAGAARERCSRRVRRSRRVGRTQDPRGRAAQDPLHADRRRARAGRSQRVGARAPRRRHRRRFAAELRRALAWRAILGPVETPPIHRARRLELELDVA